MRVVSFNANGIRAAARKGFFTWMRAAEPDVVCMQETKAHEHQVPAEAHALEGYQRFFLDAEKKGYSGVAIFSRVAPRSITRGLGFADLDPEARFIRADFETTSIASLYVPSGTSGPERQAVKYGFLDRLLPEMRRMREEGRPMIVCGDYNIAHRDIDVYDPRRCAGITGFLPLERAWFDRLVDEAGWIDAFRVVDPAPRRFTWWSGWKGAFENDLGWRIDYQMITPELRATVRSASIARDPRFSDHAPVTIDYEFELR